MCQYKGCTYIGLQESGVARIDEQGNVESEFIELDSLVLGLRAHNDRLYMRLRGEPNKLSVL